MRKLIKYLIFCALTIVLVWSCSTERNSFINRNYHTLTAQYNGYFNANELITTSLNTFQTSLKENYYEILPIEALPDEKEVIGLYPAIDTAIVKSTKVIQKHSMPSNDKPSKKNAEHNQFIDENWILIGKASYYRRDYDLAMKNFKFIRKFFANDPSLYVGELWMAKTNIALKEFTEAQFNLDNLDKVIKAESDKAKNDKKTSKSKKNSKKEEETAKFPKNLRFDFETTKADLALKKGDTEKGIEYLEESLKYAKKSEDKARINFILGQLYEKQGKRDDAAKKFKKVGKYHAKFEMLFNAKIKRAVLKGDVNTKKELQKMLRDPKNAEYKDQIYYALAEIELNDGNIPKGKDYLTNSAFYSTSNTRQKGMAYEKLGNLSFSERNYVSAQKYYDSTAKVINDSYPNAEGIRNKADNLSKLVIAVETAQFEDSIQKISAMSDGEKETFLKNYITKRKADEEARKKREAQKLLELQKTQNAFDQNLNGGKGYWSNAKARVQGYDEFRKLWGQRENEDDWRRSEKIVFATFAENDSLNEGQDKIVKVQSVDSLTVESLLAQLPQNDSAIEASRQRLVQAYYNAGVIYKDQLNELDYAKTQFNNVLDRKYESNYNVMSAFQLYGIYKDGDMGLASQNKSYILDNYPNSDYANYLRDPDYFVKRKELMALQEQEYITVLDRYNRRLYYPVIARADEVIESEKDNEFRAKYMLLKAMSLGQTSSNKLLMKPVLEQIVAEYKDTPESVRALEMLDVIKNGYSKDIEANFAKNNIYTYSEKAHYVIIFLEPKTISSTAKTSVVNFNKESFSRDRLQVDSKIYDLEKDISIVVIKEFKTDLEALEYIRVFKNTRRNLGTLQDAKIVAITQKNLQTLFQTQKLTEYQSFYDEFY